MVIRVDLESYVVFDLDDTLYPEIQYLISAFHEIAFQVDPTQSELLFREMFEVYSSNGNAFQMVVQKYPSKNLTTEKLKYLYRNHIPVISLHDGVPEMLQKIKIKGGKIGVITNGRSVTQRNKINALGLEKKLNDIVISEEVGCSKPDELIFRYLSDKNPGYKFYYFGDNLMIDFLAPKRLSWHCVGIINSDCIHKPYFDKFEETYYPHEFITSFTEVLIL